MMGFLAGFYNRILFGIASLIRIGYASPVRSGGGEAIVGFQSACNQQVDTILATLRILFDAVVLSAAGRVGGIGRCGYAQDFALRVVEGDGIDGSSGVVKGVLCYDVIIRGCLSVISDIAVFCLLHTVFLPKYFRASCRICIFFNRADFSAAIAVFYAIL